MAAETDDKITFFQDEGGREFIELNETGDVLKYGTGAPDFWYTRSKQGFSTGSHYVEIDVVRMEDEGCFGIISNLDVVGAEQWISRADGVHYYAGRRHKGGSMNDGVACLKIDAKPQYRMFHVADGNTVGISIDCDQRIVSFYLDNIFQGQVPWPETCKAPVYVTVCPDIIGDEFHIRRGKVPHNPSGLEAWRKWLIHCLVGQAPKHGDVVDLDGRSAIVRYGPDLQGDMQLMFNEVYPTHFPVSGDLNIKDPGVNVGRYLTTLVMLVIFLCLVACPVFLVRACTEAFNSTGPLRANTSFKANLIFIVLSSGLGLYSAMLKAPHEKLKERFFRATQIVPSTLAVLSILCFGASEFDLNCPEERWGPMIPAIAQLYAPNGSVNGTYLRDHLQFVAFLPFVSAPSLQLPTMDHSISPNDKHVRDAYYCTEILLLILTTCAIIELGRRLTKAVLKCRKREANHELAKPLLAERSHSSVDLNKKVRWYSSYVFWYILTFFLWFVAYQGLMYVLMDIMLMAGAVNTTTGPAWEFWVAFIEFICATHLITALVRYARSVGVQQKPPTLMVFTTLMPFFGNELHIFKDHVAGALNFAVAHCAEDDGLRKAGLTLAYCSLAATFIPVPFLFSNNHARRGLVRAHWPIMEAPVPEDKRHGERKIELSPGRGVVVSGGQDAVLAEEAFTCSDENGLETIMEKVHGEEKLNDTSFDPQLNDVEVEWKDGNEWKTDEPSNDKYPLTLKVKVIVRGCPRFEQYATKGVGQIGSQGPVEAEVGGEEVRVFKVKLSDGRLVNVPENAITPAHNAKLSDGVGCRAKAHLLFYKFRQDLSTRTREFIDFVIPSVTIEKQLRAFIGEFPHGILHVSYVFYFGGSVFIFAAIAISAFKVLAIPIIRENRLPDWIPKYGCSQTSLKIFRENTPNKCIFTKNASILEKITEFEWHDIQKELVFAGMPEDASDVADSLLQAAARGQGQQLRVAFGLVSQETKFVLADAVCNGNMENVTALVKCGFDLRSAYSHEDFQNGHAVSLDTIISQVHGRFNNKGERELNETGKALMTAIGR